MDENFFLKAMKAVGIPVHIVDESTFKGKPMPDNGNDIQIIMIEHYKAAKERPCAWAQDGHVIRKGHMYVKAVYKDEAFKEDHICLSCWVGK